MCLGFVKSRLDNQQVAALIGPVATNTDSRNLQTEELRDLIDAVAQAATSMDMTAGEIGPVPVDKLDANDLPGHWYSLISGGWQNAYLVSEYIDHHPQPLIGERIARLLTEKYQYYKQQHLGPGDIMSALYVSVTGEGTVSPERQVAAQALLAHLFESCDIFENLPEKTAQ